MRSLLSALARVALVASASLAAQSMAGQPVIEPARSGPCVEDAPTMRRQHMEYLKHQRDATVHGGLRGAKYSLKSCVACHASQLTNSVTAVPTNFCVSCHSYAAVKIDCFECHANQPAP